MAKLTDKQIEKYSRQIIIEKIGISGQKKISSSRRGMRRSHHALSDSLVMECPNCGAEKRPHHVCPSCGYYNKRQIVQFKKVEDKKE